MRQDNKLQYKYITNYGTKPWIQNKYLRDKSLFSINTGKENVVQKHERWNIDENLRRNKALLCVFNI